MNSLHNWALRNLILPITLLPTPTRYLRLARQMDKRQRWPLERIKNFQLAKLRLLIQRALSDSKFYCERLNRSENEAHALATLEKVARLLSACFGIMVRSGFRCAEPLHKAFDWRPTVRATLSHYNTEQEIERLHEA